MNVWLENQGGRRCGEVMSALLLHIFIDIIISILVIDIITILLKSILLEP